MIIGAGPQCADSSIDSDRLLDEVTLPHWRIRTSLVELKAINQGNES